MVFAKAPQSNCPSDSEVSTPSFNPMQLLQAAIEGFMDGIMIVTDQGEVIEANLRAREICCRLNPSLSHERQDPRETFLLHPLPAQIWQVCQALVESRDRFPNYPVISESEIVLDNSVMSFTIRVRVRWLDPDFDSSREVYRQRPCMLVMLEDRNQAIHNQRSRIYTNMISPFAKARSGNSACEETRMTRSASSYLLRETLYRSTSRAFWRNVGQSLRRFRLRFERSGERDNA